MKAFEGTLKISYDLEELFSNHTEIEFALFYPTELRDSVDKDYKTNEVCINGPLEIIDLDMEKKKFVLRDKLSNLCITIDEKCIASNKQIFLSAKDTNYPVITEYIRLNEKLTPKTNSESLGYVWFRNGEDADWRIVYIKKALPWGIIVHEIEYDSDGNASVSSKSYNASTGNLGIEIEFIEPHQPDENDDSSSTQTVDMSDRVTARINEFFDKKVNKLHDFRDAEIQESVLYTPILKAIDEYANSVNSKLVETDSIEIEVVNNGLLIPFDIAMSNNMTISVDVDTAHNIIHIAYLQDHVIIDGFYINYDTFGKLVNGIYAESDEMKTMVSFITDRIGSVDEDTMNE